MSDHDCIPDHNCLLIDNFPPVVRKAIRSVDFLFDLEQIQAVLLSGISPEKVAANIYALNTNLRKQLHDRAGETLNRGGSYLQYLP